MSTTCRVVVIGAGPYALSTAAFLRQAGIEPRLFGEVMGFWQAMPEGMLLRSYRKSSSIADPDRMLNLDAFEASVGRPLGAPVSLADFVDYGHWFREQADISVDPRTVTSLERNGSGFRVTLSDSETLDATSVVVAVGIRSFAWRPPIFERLDPKLVSHTSEQRDFSPFAGRRVLVVGAGQSALEAAVFLDAAGASTELVARRPALRFLHGERLNETPGILSDLLYPEWGVGPPGVNWLMGRPALYRRLPSKLAEPLAYRAIRPAGSLKLQARLEGVPITTGREVKSVEAVDSQVRLELDDGSTRQVDHVVLGTGYRIDLGRYSFMAPDLLSGIRLKGPSPRLSPAFESSIPNLYFVGAVAAASAGPGFRFVSHTGFAAKAITGNVRERG